MTNRDLDAAASKRGFKSAFERAEFRAGYTAACNGRERAHDQAPAWLAGYDFLAEAQRQAAPRPEAREHTIKIGRRPFPVVIQPGADGGVEIIVPIEGETTTVYGATEDEALAAATERLREAAELAKKRGPLVATYDLHVDVAGATWDVVETEYKSGAFELRVATYPQIRVAGDENADQEAALDQICDALAAHLGAIEAARTVDGEPAKIDTTPRPRQPTLVDVEPDVPALVRKLAAADDDIERCEIALKPHKDALAAARERREAIVVQLVAAGHRAEQPGLPLGAT